MKNRRNQSQSVTSETAPVLDWPIKRNLLGLDVSCVEYDEAVRCIISAAKDHRPAIVSCHAVHAVTTISQDESLRRRANEFSMITPDGQPVRWALNWLYKANLRERVYGPELMRRVLNRASDEKLPVYLYGGTTESLEKLESNLLSIFPDLTLAGSESPPFRKLTDEEMEETAKRINQSGARLLFIGLGCPKQDQFAASQANQIAAVQICVGAAFDFHALVKPMAPIWMQDHGLEWVFRLWCEPRRLWKRYFITNSQFCMRLIVAYFSQRHTAEPDY